MQILYKKLSCGGHLSDHLRQARWEGLHGDLPDSVLLQKPLNGNTQLAQEAFDDRTALGKLVLHLDLQHVRGQRHKVETLRGHTKINCL